MGKVRFIYLLLAGLIISTATALSAPPQNYKIVYNYRNPDGKLTNIVKYYMRDGLKFRSEYYSTTSYNISAEAKSSAVLNKEGKPDGDAKAEVKTEQVDLKNLTPHTVEILRKDKELVWTIDPEYKMYSENTLRKDSWERVLNKISLEAISDLKKTGNGKVLNFDCDIYEVTRKIQEDEYTNIAYVSKDLNVVLKTELLKNGKLQQVTEASEFNTDKPDASLFELPGGYAKNENK